MVQAELPKTMNSIIIENAEGQVSFSSNTPVPEKVEGLHCVKVEMAPINQADLLQMCSKKDPPTTFPSVPGYEGVGHVVGGQMDGMRVAFGVKKGSYAEYVYTAMVIPVPESLPSEQAACAIVNPLTAIGMVDRAIELKAESVIISAAGSALAKMFITLLLKNNIKPICTVRKEEVAQELKKEFNIDTVYCSSDSNFQANMEEVCKANNASVCFECIGDETCGQMLKLMIKGATLILYGSLSGKMSGAIDNVDFLQNDKHIEAFYLGTHFEKLGKEGAGPFVGKMLAMLGSGELKTVVQAKFGLHEIKDAIETYQKNFSAGKVLLCPGMTDPSKGQSHKIQQ